MTLLELERLIEASLVEVDKWLAELIPMRFLLDLDKWQSLAAIGMIFRYSEKVPKGLSGWLKVRTAIELSIIEKEALDHADELRYVQLPQLEPVISHNPNWQSELLNLCHERDDAEGVLILLRCRQRGKRLTGALKTLDIEARKRLGGVPRDLFDDYRLCRAKSFNPRAWWVAFVAPEE